LRVDNLLVSPWYGLGPRWLEVAAISWVKSVILMMIQGGPTHIDTFDPKPEAPAEVRGKFKPMTTDLPGIEITEDMPRPAQIMDKLTFIRSVIHSNPGHRQR
jgi:hypothetical protein